MWEVEFELMTSGVKQLMECAEGDRMTTCQVIAEDLIQSMNVIFDRSKASHPMLPQIRGVQVDIIRGVDTRKIANRDLDDLREQVISCIPTITNHHKTPSEFGFPGSMPVSLSRNHLRFIQEEDYQVSEKCDGVRYMLLITTTKQQKSAKVYLIDRKFDVFEVAGLEVLVKCFANSRTLMDGEIVYDFKTQKPKFVLFDALEINDTNYASLPLSRRLPQVGNFVRILREELQKRHTPLPLEFFGKLFLSKSQIGSVLSCIDKNIYHKVCALRHFIVNLFFFSFFLSFGKQN